MGGGVNSGLNKELSIVGKEILQSTNNSLAGVSANIGGSSQLGSMQGLDKIIYQAKEESRYPKA